MNLYYIELKFQFFYLRLLEEDKYDVNMRHPLGWTLLHVTAVNGKSENMKVLLDLGANPDLGDEYVNIYRTAQEKRIHYLEGKINLSQILS